jgi:dihydrofolate synthase/folylpolyglutamate synthase
MVLGLEQMRALDCALGEPSKRFPSVHVGGTNGKGSVSWKLAHALTASGYKVGLFTSPHISTFRERILLNGKMVSQTFLEQ